jgi:hypothetical protein
MAKKAKKAETKKPQRPARKATIRVGELHDSRRWWHLLKVYTLLLPQHGESTGFDLWQKLNDRELYPCVHRPTNSTKCYVRSFWKDCEFEETHGSTDVQLKNQPVSMLPGGVTYVTGLATSGGKVGFAPAQPGTLGLDVVTPWGRFDAREFYVRQADCVKVWPALAPPQATEESEPEESERGKAGPRPTKEWKWFVTGKYYTEKHKFGSELTARQLADLCGEELGWKPKDTAINELLRELRKLLR